MFDKQKYSIYDEKAADEQVIKSLRREISRLRGEIQMSKVLVDAEGTLFIAHQYDEITAEELENTVNELQHEHDNAVALKNKVTAEAAPVEAPPAPVEPEVPAAPVEAPVVEAPPDAPATEPTPAEAVAPTDPVTINNDEPPIQ